MTSQWLLLLLLLLVVAAHDGTAAEGSVEGRTQEPLPSAPGATPPTQKIKKEKVPEHATLSTPQIPEDACINNADEACNRVSGQEARTKNPPLQPPPRKINTPAADKVHPSSVPPTAEHKPSSQTASVPKKENVNIVKDDDRKPEVKQAHTRKIETKEHSQKDTQESKKLHEKPSEVNQKQTEKQFSDNKKPDNKIETSKLVLKSENKKPDVNTKAKASDMVKESSSEVKTPTMENADAKHPPIENREKSHPKTSEVKQSTKIQSVEKPTNQKNGKDDPSKMPKKTESDKRSEGDKREKKTETKKKVEETKPTDVKPAVEVRSKVENEVKIRPKEVIEPKESPNESTPKSRILAVLPVNARSHFVAFAPMFRALAERGHHVDVVSHFFLPDPPKGYRDLSVNGSFPSWDGAVEIDAVAGLNALTDAITLWSESLEICAAVLEHAAVQEILRSNLKYDLVISEIFGAECLLGFANRFKAPLIGIISSVAPPGSLDRVGSPDHPAYISNYFLPFVPPLSFWQRAANAAYGAAVRRLKSLLCDRANDALARRYFGEGLPSTNELAANTSLVLVNSHPASNQPRPLVPAVVEVGGLHIGDPKPLPKDLEQLLSSARHGVVLLSFGTMVRLASFPAERLAGLWAALGSLQQLVLVKSGDPLPGAPANVHVRPWLPQSDILNHPNVVLMITHGGMLGVQEAMSAGVPMLGVPFFSDQHLNLHAMVAKGAGLMLEHYEFTEEKLKHVLHRLLNDDRFRAAARAVSKQFRDRPLPPLQTAVWWVEYVLRHRGAPHLRCAAADLPWPQLLLLDVAAACATALALAAALLWIILSAVYRAIRFGTAPKDRLPAVSADGRAKRYSKKKVH